MQDLCQEFLHFFLGTSLREIILIEVCGTKIAYALAYMFFIKTFTRAYATGGFACARARYEHT